jgi:hypothetical protein
VTFPWSKVVVQMDRIMKGSGQICAFCAFSRTEHGSSTLRELVHKSMTKRSKYGCANRFDVQDLGIVDDLLNIDWTLVAVRKNWTLALVFELEKVTKMQTKRTMFGHEEVHSHDLGMTIGLTTQSVQGMG